MKSPLPATLIAVIAGALTLSAAAPASAAPKHHKTTQTAAVPQTSKHHAKSHTSSVAKTKHHAKKHGKHHKKSGGSKPA
jgi:uncharacterized low-complexity protein